MHTDDIKKSKNSINTILSKHSKKDHVEKVNEILESVSQTHTTNEDDSEVSEDSVFNNPDEYKTGTIIKTLQNIYLDFRNNYATFEKFAEHNGLSVEQARQIITIGKELHNTGGYVADR